MEFYHPYGLQKAAHVERFLRSLKNYIRRYMISRHTFRYIDVLQRIVDAYNHRYTRVLQMAPANVNQNNAKEVFFTLYGDPVEKFKARKNIKGKKLHKRYRFKEGDTVRIATERHAYTKGYEQNYSNEIFRIKKRLRLADPVQYRLESLNGEEIKGKFYASEMTKAIPNENDVFEIEKIVEKRKKNGKNEVKVKWLGYDSSQNQWINEEDLIHIPGNQTKHTDRQ